jgi:hypothetical protein
VSGLIESRVKNVLDRSVSQVRTSPLYGTFVFNLVNRLANVFGYSWDTEEERSLLARALHRTGYRVPGFLLR